MIIDFCHHSVRSKIRADKVPFDGHEVHNLISNNFQRKRKGYLSDHFVKPPVNITIQLPCNVSIYRIVIDPVIGQQKSSDIKIFTAKERVNESCITDKSQDNLSTDGIRFNCVGHIYQSDPVTVCFDNPLFKERHRWTVENLPCKDTYPASSVMNSRHFGGLSDVSHVTVCISRTVGAKSVAIKMLEIWGIPSTKVPHKVQQTLKDIYSASLKKEFPGPMAKSQTVILEDKKSSFNMQDAFNEGNLIERNGIVIPDEFTDPITCEIMSIPVLLPSGKTVDQSTLERHVNSEASWGRPPSDPFTGVIFKTGMSPVTNVSLKARIDQFLHKHSDSLQVPQTLGHSDKVQDNVQGGIVSRVVEHSCKNSQNNNKKSNQSSVDLNVKSSNFDGNCELTDFNKTVNCFERKRKRSGEQFEVKKTKNDSEYLTSKTITSTSVSLLTSISDHKSDLDRSLDSALLSTLSSLPSFTLSKQKKTQNTEDKQCSKCSTDLSIVSVIKYRLKCKHLICRECLLPSNTDTTFSCGICSTMYDTSDAVRVF
ncbi:RING finger protein 37 [Mactra antiquata]